MLEALALETVCGPIVRVRAVEVEDLVSADTGEEDATLSPDPAIPEEDVERPADEAASADPVYAWGRAMLANRNQGAQIERLALAWLGRGDYQTVTNWPGAVARARG